MSRSAGTLSIVVAIAAAFAPQAALAAPVPCPDAGVEKAARLLAELPGAALHRQREIVSEVAEALGAAAPDRGCWGRALTRAGALLGGQPEATSDAPAPLDQGKQSATLGRIRAVRVALLSYAAEQGNLPPTEEGLKAMVDAGILRREDILDAWGRVLIYRRGTADPMELELTSAGPDGKPHTMDDVSLPYP